MSRNCGPPSLRLPLSHPFRKHLSAPNGKSLAPNVINSIVSKGDLSRGIFCPGAFLPFSSICLRCHILLRLPSSRDWREGGARSRHKSSPSSQSEFGYFLFLLLLLRRDTKGSTRPPFSFFSVPRTPFLITSSPPKFAPASPRAAAAALHLCHLEGLPPRQQSQKMVALSPSLSSSSSSFNGPFL